MTLFWHALLARMDAFSLRERVFLFLSLMACLLALVDTVWLSPAQTEHRQLVHRVEQQRTQLQKLRAEVLVAAKPDNSPARALRTELEQSKARVLALDGEIRTASSLPGSMTPLAQSLVYFLKQQDGLTLVRTETFGQAEPGAKAGAVSPPAAALPAGLTRQGVEVTVAGSYPDLTRYVQTLEKALPALRWGQMTLTSTGKGVNQLTLQVFLVGGQL